MVFSLIALCSSHFFCVHNQYVLRDPDGILFFKNMSLGYLRLSCKYALSVNNASPSIHLSLYYVGNRYSLLFSFVILGDRICVDSNIYFFPHVMKCSGNLQVIELHGLTLLYSIDLFD